MRKFSLFIVLLFSCSLCFGGTDFPEITELDDYGISILNDNLRRLKDSTDKVEDASTTVSVDGSSVTDPNFNDGGDINFSASGSTVTASLKSGVLGGKIVYIKAQDSAIALATGNGLALWTVPSDLTGMDLTDADACVYTVSSSGLPSFQIHNLTDTSDMLSTNITIDASEFSSYTATTAPVINTSNDDVVTGDRIRIDVDGAGTGTKGLDIILVFE